VNNRVAAFLAYLVPILGPLYAMIAHRGDAFVEFHARQSLTLTALAIGAPLGWMIVAWVMLWIPSAGPLIAVPGFTLVILIYIFLAVAWLVGMANALRFELKPLPIVGRWAERISAG
jgi:uncharacterized membrane protein